MTRPGAVSPQTHAEMFGLSGYRSVVTGGNRGIGAAIALALAAAGADVISVHRAPEPPPVGDRVREMGRQYVAVRADLADTAALPDVADRICREHGPIDILVNNAGVTARRPAAEHRLADWQSVLDVDLTAAFVLSQAFGRPMLRRGSGRIVNIASVLSFQGGINVVAYAAAKHGLAGLTRALANEWAGSGVNVNAVAPGYIATDQTVPLRADATRNRQILERTPSGRWGTPEDVAGAVVFLCSPAASWVHGHVLAVDGGWLSR